MATNKVQDGKVLYCAVGAGVSSGDPVVVGSYLHGVALTDRDSAGKANLALDGVWNLPVTPYNGSAGSAVQIGDAIYYDATSPAGLNKNGAGVFFGLALEAIAASPVSASNIDVLVQNVQIAPGVISRAALNDAVVDDSSIEFGGSPEELRVKAAGITKAMLAATVRPAFMAIGGGIHTVADSPLDTAEDITVAGAAAGDVAVASMQVNGGSPKLYIVSVIAATGKITVTASGTFTAGDKIAYTVSRATT